MLMQVLIYNIVSTCALFFACAIISFKSPVHSILSLVLSIMCTIVILFLLRIEFLAYIYLIVYMGAIVILFLFVMMLLHVRELPAKKEAACYSDPILYIVIIIKLFYVWVSLRRKGIIFYINENFSFNASITANAQDIWGFGLYIYTEYSFNFLLVSLILLISMVGTVVLATNK